MIWSRVPRTLIIAVTAILTFLVCHAVHAQTLVIATGGPAGTYHAMFKELDNRCGNGDLKEVASSGSNENVDKMVANQVNGAFVQTDVLILRSKTEDLSKVKTLFSLHSEQVHLIARAEGIKEGGVLGFGAKTIHFNTISDLAGRNVGGAGGSILTAKVIKAQSGINFNVAEFPSNKAALDALQAGQVDGVVIVGGEPMSEVAALPATYRLLPIPAPVQDKLKAVYQPARLSYRNLNAAGVPTVSIRSLLVTREYKSPRFVQALTSLRTCFMKNIDDIQETTGTAPAWQTVDPKDQGKWQWYDLGK
jgi:TRAP transporter TAXI family solute receptor